MEKVTVQNKSDKEEKVGYFGNFGGAYVPEVLNKRFKELYTNFLKIKNDNEFQEEYLYYLKDYVGRPSPLYYAKNFSNYIGSKVYLKREDLNHTGAHKINNTIGQVLLAKRMGYKKIIAETGAGQHGVATATASALFGMECIIFMGRKDYDRQLLNVNRIKLLGAKVIAVEQGSKSLKDAVDAALEYFIDNPSVFINMFYQIFNNIIYNSFYYYFSIFYCN